MKTNHVLLMLWAATVIFHCSLFSQESIQIGTSNCATATAYNNGRRIARIGYFKWVVFQDSIDNRPVIKRTISRDGGISWSNESIIAYGSNPSITSYDFNIYYCWVSEDQKHIVFRRNDEEYVIQPDSAVSCHYPDIEVTSCFPSIENHIHVVWEQKNINQEGSYIYYHQADYSDIYYHKADSSNVIRLSAHHVIAEKPSITGCIEQTEGSDIYILWTEFDLDRNSSWIQYCSVTACGDMGSPDRVSNFEGMYPSVSVRSFINDETAYVDGSMWIAYSTKDFKLYLGLYELDVECHNIVDKKMCHQIVDKVL